MSPVTRGDTCASSFPYAHMLGKEADDPSPPVTNSQDASIDSLEIEFELPPGSLRKAADEDFAHVSETPERLRAFALMVKANINAGRWHP